MSRFENLSLATRYAVKEALWLLGRHRPGPAKDIALFSTRRSGSTWLMEVIAVNRGVRYSDQPFSLHHPSPGHARRLPIPARSQFTSLEGEDEARVRAFVAAVLDGSLSVNAPWELWHPAYHWRTDRVVLKIVDAKPLIDWLDQTFALHIVYSTRHPLPASLSVIRNGWALTAQAYLQDPRFVEAWLTERDVAYAWDVLRGGTPLEQHVLNWTLENLVPLRLLPERPRWLVVPYEAATLDPAGTVDLLADRLDLPDRERMRKQARVASRSTRRLASAFDPADEARARLRSWRRHVTEAEEDAAFRILDRFGVDLYRRGEDLPAGAPAGALHAEG
ncbi:MAG: hypothetical protein R3181_04225 [Rubricoccaceae bacterium]|nr:hypothetical protein [Rubricoccaceae bacterium]